MAERLTPGVYIEEVPSGIRPIQGVGTSTAGFIGEAARGVPDQATLVSGYAQFERLFGPIRRGAAGHLAAAVQAFFDAGGRRAYVVRVLPSNAAVGVSPTVQARGADPFAIVRPVLRFRARGAGAWSRALRIHIEPSTAFQSVAFRVRIEWTENGTSRTVETFDNLRMDATHEDYVVEAINDRSRYVEVVDLYQAFLDDEDRDEVSIPEVRPALATDPARRDTSGQYAVFEGARLTFTWTDGSSGARHEREVEVDDAFLAPLAGPAFVDGVVRLTAAQLATALGAAAGGNFVVTESSGVVSIAPAVATPAYVLLRPAAGTDAFEFGGAAVTTTITGAGADIVFDATGTLDARELADLIRAELVGDPRGIEVESGDAGVLVRVPAAATGTTLGVTSTYGYGVVRHGGAAGTVVESLAGVTITVAESLAAGVRQLSALGLPARAVGVGQNSSVHPFLRPALTQDDPVRLEGGTDGSGLVDATRFEGSAAERTGLHAFDTVDVNILCLPGRTDPAYLNVAMEYADSHNAFFVADGPGSDDRQIEIRPADAMAFVEGLPNRSMNAAMYYPWIQVADPTGVGRRPTRFVPPCGHIAGIFARTDLTRGVWKAPAGIEAVVNGALATQYAVVDADQDLLNPIGLNCIRQFPGVGIVSWGSRTLSSDPEWRYVPVRRTALFLKESLRRGMQWAVFQPNDTELWDRIRINITAFMLGLFRQGAFQGATPEEAFLVKCDRETNPQELVDQGIVTATVAWAPLKPAEFVVIQVSQKALVT